MSNITVIGGNGYAGAAVVAEAAKRGHGVVSVGRKAPATPIDGVDYRVGNATDLGFVADAIAGADAVFLTLSPRGDLEGEGVQLALYQDIAKLTRDAGARLIIMGGWTSLREYEGGPRNIEKFDKSVPWAGEILEGVAIQEWITSDAPEGLNWTFVSPAAAFGGQWPGEPTGKYRVAIDVAIDGDKSKLSAADLALAVVDIIESGEYAGQHINVVE